MTTCEKELVKRSQEGDIESFEKLISQYQKKVFNIALGMIRNYDDAYDASQEVFLRVYKSIKKFKGQSSFSTWLYRITTNVCLDELRKRKKNINNISIDQEILLENGEVFRQIEDHENIPDLQAEKNELNRIIRNAIYNLSDEHKEVIVLRDIQGFSYNDIANIIKCPEGTVKSRINRSRKILKEALKSKMELWNEDYVK